MNKFEDVLFFIFIFFFIVIFISCSCITLYKYYKKYNAIYNELKEKYDTSSATIIDTHITYTRYGTPCYYFVYKFSDGFIKQVQVNEEQYYKNLNKKYEGS